MKSRSLTALDALCQRFGITSEYTDIWGATQQASDETRQSLLQALGALDEQSDLAAALRLHEMRAWRQPLPPAMVFCGDHTPYRLRLRLPEGEPTAVYRWTLALEDGEHREGEFRLSDLELLERYEAEGEAYIEVAFDWRDTLPLGYHRYTLEGPGVPEEAWTSFIVGPASCYLPPALESGARVWGPVVQLYGVRSERNWGMGDFSDLASIVEQWGRHGAGVVGANPLHALYPHNPAHASPYSPSSRLFSNVLYIDVEAVPDARECVDVLATMGTARFQTALQAARASELVDYAAVAALKLPLLEAAYAHFREHQLGPEAERGAAFRRFQAESGPRLRQHALFEALQSQFFKEDPSIWGWPVWPEAYRTPESPQVQVFVQNNIERIEYFEYLQWQAAIQLQRAGTCAKDCDYAVGMYQDLAISIDRGGAESWANQDVYAVGASIGAPPDEVNLKGQNWGLPPLRPERLKAARYDPFIATLRANMRYSGALRIDHVMGLFRLYWIPPGASAAAGAYVCYPFSDLLTILALESHRHRCMVIGEDLGTVPDEVREGLSRARVMSYRLLFFERTPTGDYMPPVDYPADALVAASTHDLATLAGFWEGRDLEVRQKLDLFPSEELRQRYVENRVQDRARLMQALERENLLANGRVQNPSDSPMTAELARAVHDYLALTPSRLMVVQPEDVLGVRDQANLPGTVDEHPNWRRKLPVTLEELESNPRFRDLTESLARLRPAPASTRAPRPKGEARIPRATYRFQLNRDFTFNDATALVPYLSRLGISHVYCSPYLRARPGSTHGYDIIDHNTLNPEIGTPADFERFLATLSEHGMSHILDMVPNHMGVMGADNAWWLDVLENGRASAYADFFDIQWEPANPTLRGKVLIPVLGDQYGLVLERGELKLRYDSHAGAFSVCYYDHHLPLDPREYPRVLDAVATSLEGADLPEHAAADLGSLSSAFRNLPARDEAAGQLALERRRDVDVHKRRLAQLSSEHESITHRIEEEVQVINGTPGEPASFERLHELLEQQAYRLASWRVAADEINYRRFFDINDLAALRMEHPGVFDETHRFVLKLCAEGKVQGLRIDHPDGLYDPQQYFNQLQQCYAQIADVDAKPSPDGRPPRPLYVVIEKIAAVDEPLPETWAVYGTSGYRFATVVNQVLVDPAAAEDMERVYRGFATDAQDYAEAAHEGKRAIMATALAAPLMMLATELARIARMDRRTRDYTLNNLRRALAEVVACFPVYRTYIVDAPSAQDRRYIESAVSEARLRTGAADTTIFQFVKSMLLAEAPPDASPELRERVRSFAMKMQQFTAPVMAKGVEDTAFYLYHRLISLNDVGGDPDQFGMTVLGFHAASAERAAHRPHTMLATSTHDNKRSEDVRTRIDVLSEMPGEWRAWLRRWQRMNRSKTTEVDGGPVPTPNDEYLLYQILLGTFPNGEADEDALAAYCTRVQAYMLKAGREAKVRTSWVNPNEAYEKAIATFIERLITAPGRNLFLKDLRTRSRTLAWFGMLNSLSMALLKLTSPGVPDVYQGNETIDLSLVDPDNRRPVDYARRTSMLDVLEQLAALPQLEREVKALAGAGLDGRAKMWVIWRVLGLRREQPDLFRLGNYLPLRVEGARTEHVIAFTRNHRGTLMIVVVGRLWMKLGAAEDTLPLGSETWRDTVIESGAHSGPLTNVLTGETVQIKNGRIHVGEAFASFPAALLVV